MEDRVDENGNLMSNIYRRKNEYLRLSLDVSSYSADQYQKFCTWVQSHRELTPRAILDIGCDNGLASCFYALLFPKAKVVAIDVNEKAIQCAKELANQLELKNIEFQHVDFAEIQEHFASKSFDLIVSQCALHEIVRPVMLPRAWSIREGIEKAGKMVKEAVAFTMLQNLLADDGVILSMERLSNVDYIAAQAVTLERSGLFVDWSKSQKITYDESGEWQTMPALFISKSPTEISIFDGVTELYVNPSVLSNSFGTHLTDAEAEVMFHQVEPKELVMGTQIMYYNGSGTRRIEVWKSGAKLLGYRYSNLGYRDLKILPKGSLSTIKKELKKMEKDFEDFASVTSFSTTEERDRLEEM